MKIIVDRNKLLEAFKSLLPIVNSNGSGLGITENVKLEANGDMVLLTGTSLKIFLSVKVPCEVKEAGSTTLPLKRLNSLIKEMVKGEVTIDSGDGDTSSIRCGSSKFKVNGLSAVEFPACPSLDDKSSSFSITQDSLRKVLKQASYACGNDETRVVFRGVLFEIENGKLNVVSTNGRMLAFDTADTVDRLGTDANTKGRFVIPLMIRDSLLKTLIQSDSEVHIRFSKNCVLFNFGDVELYTKVIDGEYPNYKQVMPTNLDRMAIVEKAKAVSMLRLVSVVSDDKFKTVSVCFETNKMTINCTSPQIGYAQDSIDVDYSGSELKICLCADYLLSIFESLETVNVGINMSDGFYPVKILGEKDSFAILMPIKLN